ncbi:MAG: BrnT family toxin [Leptolyngbyaceae cyanobacterium]
MSIEFEWDPEKAATNFEKHGVSFHEAATVFRDPLSVTFPDPNHSVGENRYIIIGQSIVGLVLIVAHTERGQRLRIITARKATRKEKTFYEEGF